MTNNVIQELRELDQRYSQFIQLHQEQGQLTWDAISKQNEQTYRKIAQLSAVLTDPSKKQQIDELKAAILDKMNLLQQLKDRAQYNPGSVRGSIASVPSPGTTGSAHPGMRNGTQVSVQEFNNNLSGLKNQLFRIHQSLQSTAQLTSTDSDAELEKIRSAEVSRMAVQQMKAQLKTQNQTLVQQNRDAIADLESANTQIRRLKHDYSELQQRNELLTNQNEQLVGSNERLQVELRQLRNDYERIINDLNLKDAELQKKFIEYQNTVNLNKINAEKQYSEIITFQTENAQLKESNQQLKEKMRQYKDYDIDNVNFEIKRAAQTIEQLNNTIDDLKDQIRKQRISYTETITNLKTTIAALHEELFGDADEINEEKLPRGILEQKLVDLHDENKQLRERINALEQQVHLSPHQGTLQDEFAQGDALLPTERRSQNPYQILESVLYSKQHASQTKAARAFEPDLAREIQISRLSVGTK